MNRVIKFRGKRVDNGEWVYGDLLKPFKSQFYVLDYSKFDYDCFEHIGEVAEQFEVVPETVGQFTGLLDKNSKEIYEGDILSTQERDIFFVIVWDSFNCGFKFRNIKTNSYYEIDESLIRLELVGNIHDNKELLK